VAICSLGGDLGLLQRIQPHPRLVAELQQGGSLIQEPLGVAAGEHLQPGIDALIHVADRRELSDRPLAADQCLAGPVRRQLGQLRFGPGVGDLDLQGVILLAKRVDLIGELPGLRHQVAERRLEPGRRCVACASLKQDGNGGGGHRQRRNSPHCVHIDARYWIGLPLTTNSLEVPTF